MRNTSDDEDEDRTPVQPCVRHVDTGKKRTAECATKRTALHCAFSDDEDEDRTPVSSIATQSPQPTLSTGGASSRIQHGKRKQLKITPGQVPGYKFSLLTMNRNTWNTTNVDIVDLFCSIGGYSTGATQAGHRIALAIDNDETALAVHSANHPEARHVNMELGPDCEEELVKLIEEVVGGRPFHLHGSPPCTKLSGMQAALKGCRHESDVKEGMRLVYWYFDLVKRLKPITWTFEQVAFQGILYELGSLKRHKPLFFDFLKVQMADFGVPQTRTRIIGGIPHMIDRLRHNSELRVTAHIGVADAITPPDGTVYIRDSSYGRKTDQELTTQLPDGAYVNEQAEKTIRPTTQPAYTVMSSCSHTWLDEQFRTIRKINGIESLAIQTFPANYLLPCNRKDQTKGIGNAIPCLFARKLMSDYRIPP